MLNGDLKKEALSKLSSSVDTYKDWAKKVQAISAELFVLRKKSSEDIIDSVETYINTLANTPKEFDRSFAEYRAEFRVFERMLNEFKIKSDNVDFEFGTTATAGVLAGVGTAAFAPTAAMAIASTFGTASTGTAISLLSGAVATNASLAWLGGGALAAGGGGMVAGEALLALAGPIGWAIGGAAILGGGLLARSKNEKLANEANDKRKEVEILSAELKAANHEVGNLIELTKNHVSGVKMLLTILRDYAPKNYNDFSSEEKDKMAALKNHIESLSMLLNKKVVS